MSPRGLPMFSLCTPSRYIRQEITKEFTTSRIWFNHYEFVDFTIFEYGQRAQYLQWRLFSLLITFLLTAHVFFMPLEYPWPICLTRFMYMHSWLAVLLLLHNLMELVVLTWTYYTTPSPVLVRIHYTPWHFKILWLLYNVLYPNIMSCNIVYYTLLRNMESQIGESRLFMSLLASFVGIHVSVTGVPSRMAHFYQPILFNLLHLVAAIVFQLLGQTDYAGHNYIYQEINWLQSKTWSVVCVIMWLSVTACCHVAIVICCWYRRLVYRNRRTRSATPIYGFSPEEYYPFSEDNDHVDHFVIPLSDQGDLSDIWQEEKLNRRSYSPHMSYRSKEAAQVTFARETKSRQGRPLTESTQSPPRVVRSDNRMGCLCCCFPCRSPSEGTLNETSEECGPPDSPLARGTSEQSLVSQSVSMTTLHSQPSPSPPKMSPNAPSSKARPLLSQRGKNLQLKVKRLLPDKRAPPSAENLVDDQTNDLLELDASQVNSELDPNGATAKAYSNENNEGLSESSQDSWDGSSSSDEWTGTGASRNQLKREYKARVS